MAALPLSTPTGSSLRKFYDGPVGQAGVGLLIAFDISDMPRAVRQDPTFVDNWHVFVRPGAGVTNVLPEPTFTLNGQGLPIELVLTLDSDNIANQIAVEAWYTHSVTR